ncbi:MAG: hypothetical protein SFY95_03875 [Planctomycetota bacterium]|nr:hypothetical protein [Planctomycetota bacterium]
MTRARAASRSRGALSVIAPALFFPALLVTSARAQAPSFQGLGGASADTQSFALGVSGDGSTVVGLRTSTTTAGLSRGFKWTSAQGFQILDPIVGQFSSRAADTNFDGSLIVGTSTQPPTVSLTASWTAPGPASGLVPLPLSAYVAGMSDSGVTIGDYLQGPAVIGYRFTGTEFAALLGFGGASANTNAVGISPEGSVVVGRAATDSGFRAARWNAGNSAAIALPQLTGTADAYAIDTSANGTVTVGATRLSASGPTVATLFATFKARDLGTLPPLDSSADWQASAIRSDGEVIVGSGYQPISDTAVVFIWTRPMGLRNLQDYLANDLGLAAQLAGWTLRSVSDMNALGTVIVGSGINPQGREEAWIAQVPWYCPADFDGSGFSDVDDFALFVRQFELGCEAPGVPAPGCIVSADVDHSGFIDSGDFETFVHRFINIDCAFPQ